LEKKLNILHLYFSLGVGGAENILIGLLNNLDRKNFNSVVCTISNGGKVADQAEELGHPVIRMNFKKINLFNKNKICAELERVVKDQSIDIIHSNMYHANYIARVVGKKLNIPVVVAIHNTYKKVKWHRQFVNWFYSRYTKKIIAGSEDIKSDILKYDFVNEGLVEVIPNAIDLSKSVSKLTKKEAKYQLGINDDYFVIGNVARLEEQKGQKYLLYALKEMADSGSNKVKLLLIGDGRQKEELKLIVNQLNLSDHVMFLGVRTDLGDLYRAMDLFVMPSLWEGLSLAMLSAMAAGVPVISTKVGGASHVLDEGRGILIQPANVFDLVNAISFYLTSASRAIPNIDSAQKYVVENHSNALMAKRYEKIFLE
jgi:glycosyltransferase involved in cell wall biosynthesis